MLTELRWLCLAVPEKLFPRTHDIIYRWPLCGVFVPAPLEESPYLDGETDSFSVRRKLGPISSEYPDRGSRVALFWKRDLASEDLDSQHRRGEDVGGF